MIKNENNRAFQFMKKDGIDMLSGKTAEEIVKNSGIGYDPEKQQFMIESLGKTYTFSAQNYDCTEEIDSWQYLTILHYLNQADGTPAVGIPITMGEMPAGLVRGTKFDHTAAHALEQFVKRHSEEEILLIFEKLGGRKVQGKADLSIQLSYLPNLPMYINIWFADEEFPPSVRLLVDQNISHYLSIEDAVTLGEYLIRLLEKE